MKPEQLIGPFQIDLSTAKQVVKCIKSVEYAESLPGGASRIKECYNRPMDYDIQLNAINKLVGGFGVEYIASVDDSFTRAYGVDYVNLGKTYSLTICYDQSSERFKLTSWGDIVESNPKRFE